MISYILLRKNYVKGKKDNIILFLKKKKERITLEEIFKKDDINSRKTHSKISFLEKRRRKQYCISTKEKRWIQDESAAKESSVYERKSSKTTLFLSLSQQENEQNPKQRRSVSRARFGDASHRVVSLRGILNELSWVSRPSRKVSTRR